ncbi:MAG: hypothetical protein GFH27_549291n324 [Chloroflexi bacterium AL-W]|nr:hypothetical protein [Chloroflexi bacterium AL-N1]NOK67208.1 hypothetical protein [Chloroflexi bacterium AL-N10]NOK75298.1 hypothetical protein [Chloroflexi bacterium AL-N5]NOK82086.1 hypothetical protein [Chloroflexi bacterium AL-W]NOK89931.1 hypothetical protein [Chloroflexi bacterium AL-N15]
MGLGEITILFTLLASTVFWVWMLIDCVQNETQSNDRLIWGLIIVLTNVIGALIHLFVRWPQHIKTANQ